MFEYLQYRNISNTGKLNSILTLVFLYHSVRLLVTQVALFTPKRHACMEICRTKLKIINFTVFLRSISLHYFVFLF